MDERTARRMARIAWISGSVVFNIALIYGVYVAKAIHDATKHQ